MSGRFSTEPRHKETSLALIVNHGFRQRQGPFSGKCDPVHCLAV